MDARASKPIRKRSPSWFGSDERAGIECIEIELRGGAFGDQPVANRRYYRISCGATRAHDKVREARRNAETERLDQLPAAHRIRDQRAAPERNPGTANGGLRDQMRVIEARPVL